MPESRKEPGKDFQALEDQLTEFYKDRRGGTFVVINGVRIHESDVPPEPVKPEVIDDASE